MGRHNAMHLAQTYEGGGLLSTAGVRVPRLQDVDQSRDVEHDRPFHQLRVLYGHPERKAHGPLDQTRLRNALYVGHMKTRRKATEICEAHFGRAGDYSEV